MPTAQTLALRVPQHLRPHRKRQPRARAGEVALFGQLDRWGIPYEYESMFFPLEFHVSNGQVSEGFQPDGRLPATARYPECFLELGLGGWCRQQRALVDWSAYERMRQKKQRRIAKLFEYYGLRTLLVDGRLYDGIVNQPGGYQRLLTAIAATCAGEMVGPPAVALAA